MALLIRDRTPFLTHRKNYYEKKYRKNREKLAKEAYDQMDLDAVEEMILDQLEYRYAGMSSEEFNEIWIEVFGEN